MLNKYSLLFHLTSFAALVLILEACQLVSSRTVCESYECVDFEVHLNNNFNNDLVQVEIDKKVVLNERVTTNHVLSLAEIIKLKRPAGKHSIKITVNGRKEESIFMLDCKLFIHVRYYSEAIPGLNIPKGVVINISKYPPLYD